MSDQTENYSAKVLKKDLANLLYREILKVKTGTFSSKHKLLHYFRLLNYVFIESSKEEKLTFSTLFARIAYICQKAGISGQYQFYIHTFRKVAKKYQDGSEESPEPEQEDCLLGERVVTLCVNLLYNEVVPKELELPKFPFAFYKVSPVKTIKFYPLLRVLLKEIREKEQLLVAIHEENSQNDILIKYNLAERNENFTSTLTSVDKTYGFPVVANLIDVLVDDEGFFRPLAFVLEPDYLIDVTTISENVHHNGTTKEWSLVKKLLPQESTPSLVLGNTANLFLDELLIDENKSFKELFLKMFVQNPIGFLFWDDVQVRQINQKAESHFLTIQQVVAQGFEEFGIQKEFCYIEPTFYSSDYGIQGRLDLYYQPNEADVKPSIVELKSGKTFRPNSFGLNPNHYFQTLLYDLLIKSTFGAKIDSRNFILYSQNSDNSPLRYAPPSKTQQMEALRLRNDLLGFEKRLTKLTDSETDNGLLESLTHLTQRYQDAKMTFVARDFEVFSKMYQGLDSLEKIYLNAFLGFVAREQQLAKTGEQGMEDKNGIAGLWLQSYSEKVERFEIISYLKIVENQANHENPVITLSKTELSAPMSNFRDGDLAILYPASDHSKAVLTNQVFKCTLLQSVGNQIVVRLRSQQFNLTIFNTTTYWHLEHDLLDSSFNAMFRQVTELMKADALKRKLWLGLSPPQQNSITDIEVNPSLLPEQQEILKKMLYSNGYFLLWGPPGTGKTSIMLKAFVRYILENTNETIALLAYTNRAVDEICEAIEQIGTTAKERYFRIGSRYSTAAVYQDKLLDVKIKDVKNRKELKEVLLHHRIVVGTVASILGKAEILTFIQCKRLVIDEASQILEPMIIGLLTKFESVILIGDHQQLPAVVQQQPLQSRVEHPQLLELGFKNLNVSLFERLYKRCQAKGWTYAFGQLRHQGRMHEELVQFVSENFYQNNLTILPNSIHNWQQNPLNYNSIENQENRLMTILSTHRMVFINTITEYFGFNNKTNKDEAEKAIQVIKAFRAIFALNHLHWTPKTLGVITPYRAQIATIQTLLIENDMGDLGVTVDTVERYQGGARDIILLSLCTNSAFQISSMGSLSEDGVDRKLNVALTRAKQHLVILGNKELLVQNPLYRLLLQRCYEY